MIQGKLFIGWFGGFYGISILVGYLNAEYVHKFIKYVIFNLLVCSKRF